MLSTICWMIVTVEGLKGAGAGGVWSGARPARTFTTRAASQRAHLPGTAAAAFSFGTVKRGLVTFCNSKSWTKQAVGFGPLSALRAHAKGPHKTGLLWKALRSPNRPRAARTLRPF